MAVGKYCYLSDRAIIVMQRSELRILRYNLSLASKSRGVITNCEKNIPVTYNKPKEKKVPGAVRFLIW